MLNVNFKGFLADNMHAYWNVGKKIYDKGDLSLPMVGCEHFCLFYWLQGLQF